MVKSLQLRKTGEENEQVFRDHCPEKEAEPEQLLPKIGYFRASVISASCFTSATTAQFEDKYQTS